MAGCSRLCAFISASLLSFIESKSLLAAKESEKDLLISLTKVSREIHKWVDERNISSQREEAVDLSISHTCVQVLDQPTRCGHDCVANVVSIIVALLGSDSSFVQHLSGNVLVVISQFLSRYESKWVQFLHLLWISIDTVISAICSCTYFSSELGSVNYNIKTLTCFHLSPEVNPSGTEDSDFDIKTFNLLLKSRLLSANWLMVAVLFQSLRKILKFLKSESDDREKVYTQVAVSSLLEMPWDLLSEIHASQIVLEQRGSCSDDLPDQLNGFLGSKDVLLGIVLQLLCSMVEQNDSEGAGCDLLEVFAIYSRFTSLVPKLLSCCFSKHLDYTNSSTSQYLRHKVLMLMMRLSFHIHWQSACSLLWLQLLRCYFEDSLFKPIPGSDSGLENSLEESPFVASISDGGKVHNMCRRHLQRQTIFLLFKCCSSLVCIDNDSVQGCTCGTTVSSSACTLQHGDKDVWQLVSSVMLEWLQKCALLDKFVDNEAYSRSCRSFALSFLQLYMEEDDMLFQMLLQLLTSPFLLMETSNSNDKVDREITLHMSSIFNTIHLFHLFLLLIHYDHLVLVDYLISKDVGIHFLHYLLRCLRIICNSWITFVEFSVYDTELKQPYQKRRKTSIDKGDLDLETRNFPSLSTVTRRQNIRKHGVGSVGEESRTQAFENAKECLLSLKRSVKDLHKKNLFPYNPKPLLRSFARFQDLCEQQEL